MSWCVVVLDQIHARLEAGQAWDELRCFERMSDEELVLLAEREIADPRKIPTNPQAFTPPGPQGLCGTVAA